MKNKFKVGDKVFITQETFDEFDGESFTHELDSKTVYTINEIDNTEEYNNGFSEHIYNFKDGKLRLADKFYNYNLRNVKS